MTYCSKPPHCFMTWDNSGRCQMKLFHLFLPFVPLSSFTSHLIPSLSLLPPPNVLFAHSGGNVLDAGAVNRRHQPSPALRKQEGPISHGLNLSCGSVLVGSAQQGRGESDRERDQGGTVATVKTVNGTERCSG